MRCCLLLSLLLATGCRYVAGLGGFVDEAGGGGSGLAGPGGMGGAPGTGGSGGSGGGGMGACIAPADWRPVFTAVWTFDDGLGDDSSGNGRDLVVGADVTTLADDAVQGTAAALLDGPEGLTTTDPDFAGDEPLTWGMWLRWIDTPNAGSAIPMTRFNASSLQGYRMVRGGAGRANCQVGNGSTIQAQSSASHVLDAGVWHHVVCRAIVVDQGVFTNALSFDGEHDADVGYANAMESPGNAELSIPDETNPFVGGIDEAFVIKQVLSDAAISRIHACGIDGARCCCDPVDPTVYDSCGRGADCGALSGLVPCDAPLPPP